MMKSDARHSIPSQPLLIRWWGNWLFPHSCQLEGVCQPVYAERLSLKTDIFNKDGLGMNEEFNADFLRRTIWCEIDCIQLTELCFNLWTLYWRIRNGIKVFMLSNLSLLCRRNLVILLLWSFDFHSNESVKWKYTACFSLPYFQVRRCIMKHISSLLFLISFN